MVKLSVVISAFNEENKIEECLESVQWADEIVVIDNGSTDKTGDIARKYTKYVFHQKNDPANIDLQKNFGIEKAKGEWVLILDADERVTPELKEEIKKILDNKQDITLSSPETLRQSSGQELRTPRNDHIVGYWMPRKNIIFGKWIEHSGWYPDYTLRLFRKGKGKFVNSHYHEPLQVDGQTEELKEHLVHNNYESVSQFFHRNIERYAPNDAETMRKKGYTFHWTDAIRFPLHEFLSRYFAREGYKDGFHGLILAFMMAVSHFAVFCYLWEKEKFTVTQTQDIAFLQKGLEKEIKNAKKELGYWMYNKKITEERNPVAKLGLRLKRKLNRT